MEWQNILIQSVGFLGYILVAVSYFCKKKSAILTWNIVASVILGIHFYLLDGLSGAICNVVGALVMLIIYLYEKRNGKNKKILLSLMLPVSILIAVFTWQDISSLLPIAASIILIAGFAFTDEQKIRITGIFGSILWLIYSIATGSISGIICQSVIALATIIAFLVHQHSAHELTR